MHHILYFLALKPGRFSTGFTTSLNLHRPTLSMKGCSPHPKGLYLSTYQTAAKTAAKNPHPGPYTSIFFSFNRAFLF